MNRPRLLRVSYLLWLLGPIATLGAYHLYGLPHVIWSYSYLGGQNGLPRIYTRCTFTGPLGEFTMPAQSGRCGWLLFRKQAGGRAQ